jgi:outer membrane protein
MTRGSRGKSLLLVVSAGCSAFLSCSVFRPEGDGGWSESRKRQELERASAITFVPPRTAAATHDEAVHESFANLPRTLDIETALTLAARHNRSIAAAERSVAMAAADVSAARSGLLPTANVRGAYTWFTDEQVNPIDFEVPGLEETPVVTVRDQQVGTVQAAVRLALDLSGEIRHQLEASQASYRAEQARAWAARLEEEREVLGAYFALLEAKTLREVVGRTVALHERQLGDARSRFELGRLTRNEVLVVDVALAGSRQLLVQLDNAISAARRGLNRVTGLPIDAATEARDVAARPPVPSLDEALDAARTANPLVVSMLEEVQAVDERLTSARRGRFPRVGAQAAYDATTSDIVQPTNFGLVGVTVDVDLYSFRREAEISRLDSAAKRSRLLLDRSVREIETLVRDSHDRVLERLTAIDTAAVATRQAEENLRIRQSQFDEGRATSEDLLDASELAARQRAAFANALYQAHVRRAELQQLMGAPLAAIGEGTDPVLRPGTVVPDVEGALTRDNPPASRDVQGQEQMGDPPR